MVNLSKKFSLLKYPTYGLNIWTTDDCNLHCKYCFYNESEIFETKFKPTYMNKEVADDTIRFINSGKVNNLCFFGGEPMMNWTTTQYILRRIHLGYIINPDNPNAFGHISMTTNGTLLTPEIIEELKMFSVGLNLSFDGTETTQNKWRGGSYNQVIKNIDLLVNYPSICVLKTMSEPENLYEDVKHIKDLGFKNIFVNLLGPYGEFNYEGVDIEDYKKQFKMTVERLADKNFVINDHRKWKELICGKKLGFGCGFTGKGLGMDPQGNFYPCHQGPSMNQKEKFIIGNIKTGIDKERETIVRNVAHPQMCFNCHYKLSHCYVTSWNTYGRFGVDAEDAYCKVEKAKIEAIEEIDGLPHYDAPCQKRVPSLILATLMSVDKLGYLNMFLESILKLELPLPTDYYIIINEGEERLIKILELWKENKSTFLPKHNNKFRDIKIMTIPIVEGERSLFRIARGRNIVLGAARKNHDTIAYVFIDADIITPPDTIVKMLDSDGDIVGGLVKCRRDDMDGWYNNYRISKEEGRLIDTIKIFEDGEILDVDATGSDCIMVKRTAFMDEIYTYKPEIPEAEDMGFCMKNRKKGRTVKIDTSIKTRHLTPAEVIIK